MLNNDTYSWVEQCIGRKLTDDEKYRIDYDIESARRINTGNVEALRSIGIDI